MVQKHGLKKGESKTISRNEILPVSGKVHKTRLNTESRNKTRGAYILNPRKNKTLINRTGYI
jgi:hypothetical protein